MTFFSDIFDSFTRAERHHSDFDVLFNHWASEVESDLEKKQELLAVLSSRAAHWKLFNKNRHDQYLELIARLSH